MAFFPPKKGQNLNHVYFFAKTDFKNQLEAPLRFTLPQSQLHVPGGLAPHERRTVDALTVPRQFRFALRRERGGATCSCLRRAVSVQPDYLLACTIGSAYA